eukprot:520124_1
MMKVSFAFIYSYFSAMTTAKILSVLEIVRDLKSKPNAKSAPILKSLDIVAQDMKEMLQALDADRWIHRLRIQEFVGQKINPVNYGAYLKDLFAQMANQLSDYKMAFRIGHIIFDW